MWDQAAWCVRGLHIDAAVWAEACGMSTAEQLDD